MCGLFSFFVGEILLQHIFIVPCLFGIFYLGLYYLYFSIKFDEVRGEEQSVLCWMAGRGDFVGGVADGTDAEAQDTVQSAASSGAGF